MLISWWMGAANAASLEGELFGDPFAVGAALGITDPAQPGALSVIVTTERLSCADAARMRANASAGKKKKPPPMVVAAFSDVRAGAIAQTVLTLGPKGMGALGGAVTLAAVPGAVGAQGTLALALAATPGARDGAFGGMVSSADTDRLQGEVSFELCTPLLERPSLAATVFEPTRLHLSEKTPIPGAAPLEIDVEASLPAGWTRGESSLGEAQWTAPDGVTRLTLGLGSPNADLEASSRGWAEMQVKAFQSESTQAELLASSLAAEGAYAVRWRHRWGEAPWSNAAVVFRQGPGWSVAVTCTIAGPDAAVAEVFDAAESACVALSAAAP